MDDDAKQTRILVASGRNWQLWWPAARWYRLTLAERQTAVARQRQLIENGRVNGLHKEKKSG